MFFHLFVKKNKKMASENQLRNFFTQLKYSMDLTDISVKEANEFNATERHALFMIGNTSCLAYLLGHFQKLNFLKVPCRNVTFLCGGLMGLNHWIQCKMNENAYMSLMKTPNCFVSVTYPAFPFLFPHNKALYDKKIEEELMKRTQERNEWVEKKILFCKDK
jgi:hypothetical protein